MERALARTYSKDGYRNNLLAFFLKREPVVERRQRPHWLNLPPLTA